MYPQLVRFLITGGLATALQYILLGVGTTQLGWPAALASGVGYMTGSVLSYVMNYFYTFACNQSHLQATARFYLMVAIGWSINTLTMAVLVDAIGWNKWLSQIIATLLTLTFNFSASRAWVFRSR
ncbi:MAG: GtrA family protein [Methylophilaceae bacterium]|uniref:GtrA family protein n=1 Tax=Methylicorpusculum sp. TaxID=2713644 RepID=UPI0027320EDF|nr:GtrA family protein [Methylicorpusculum sp.]MDP2178385.1 GtrA family protein [Methylicorpusculum sp.]MDP3530781.1 GtrA family protein [Methylicorpusculum sp.]MDZ4099319.1 GtrA family protein [Methylophilaceae bacterium]